MSGNATGIYLSGPTVCGLYGMFDADYGDPQSGPMSRITPSRIGSALLPFRCPRCDAAIDFNDPKRREHFHDTRVVDGKKRDNFWCPACGVRFKMNSVGRAHDGKVDSNGVAPAIVESLVVGKDGLVDYRRRTIGGRSFLGLPVGMSDCLVGTDALASC